MSREQPPDLTPATAELLEVFERVRSRLRSFFHRQRIAPEDAEDLLQNALVAALINWPEIRDPEAARRSDFRSSRS